MSRSNEKEVECICLHNKDGKFLYVSTGSAAIFDAAPDAIREKCIYDLLAPDDGMNLKRLLRSILPTQNRGDKPKYSLMCFLNRRKWVEIEVVPFFGTEEQVIQFGTVSRRVSERQEPVPTPRSPQPAPGAIQVGQDGRGGRLDQ